MVALLGGTQPAPLTGVGFAVEVTGDVAALAPLLAATMTAYAVTVLLLKRAILTEKIARRGQHITREYGIDPYGFTRVEAVMTRAVETLDAELPLTEALFAIEAGVRQAYSVIDGVGRPVGLTSRGDALRSTLAEQGGDPAEDTLGEHVSDADIAVVHPGDAVSHALDVMLSAGQGRLPVTDPQTGRLVGSLTRKDLLQVRATVVRAEAERRAFFRRGLSERRAASGA